MEQFENVPVSTLSPNISPRDEEKELPGSVKSLTPSARGSLTPSNLPVVNNNSALRKNSGDSVSVSPSMSRKSACTDSDSGGPRSASPGILDDEDRDQFMPDHGTFGGNGPRSLPSVHSISVGFMALKR